MDMNLTRIWTRHGLLGYMMKDKMSNERITFTF